MKALKCLLFIPVIMLLVFNGCDKEAPVTSPPNYNANSPTIVGKDPQTVVEWTQMAYNLVEYENIVAPIASRLYALTAITMYESMYRGIPGNISLSGQLKDLSKLPAPVSSLEYDWQSVAASATNRVMRAIFYQVVDEPNPINADLIEELYNKQIQRRKDVDGIEGEVVDRSVHYGRQLGQAIIDWASTDGYMETKSMEYVPPSRDENPMYWEPTTPGGEALAPFMSLCRTYTLETADQCAIPLGIDFSMAPGSDFWQEAEQVRSKSHNLTQEEKNIAFFWEDKAGTGQPPGHWIAISNIMVDQLDLKLDEALRLHTLIGIGIGDAFISCWEAKYRVNLLRPKTYIRDYMGEPNWQPIVVTPLFPEYPSGHSVVSGCSSYILTEMLGDDIAYIDNSHGDEPGLRNRSFNNFHEAAMEAAWSRLYGGIHYKSAILNGVEQGQEVGKVVLSSIHFTK